MKAKLVRAWLRAILLIFGWSVSNAASAASGIFQGVLVPSATYSGGGALPISVPLALRADPPGAAPLQAGVPPLALPFPGISIGKRIFFLRNLGIAVIAS